MQNLPDELCVSVFQFLETPQHLAKMLVCSREARALCDVTARTLLMIRQTPHFLEVGLLVKCAKGVCSVQL